MNHSLLSDAELFEKTLSAAGAEQSSMIVLLEYLTEVDRRRIYALRGFSSLWEFTHVALGYSEAQASERVNAARLLTKVPEMKAQLESGRLTLTSSAKLGSFVRREKTSRVDALSLLESCLGKTSREVEKLLLPLETQPRKDFIRPITPETTRISFDADEEFMRLYNRARELQGNLGIGMKDMLKESLRAYVKKKEPRLENPTKSVARAPADEMPEVKGEELKRKEEQRAGENTNSPLIPRQRTPQSYISSQIRLQIQTRAEGRCEYRSSETGRRCEARHSLEFDHLVPRAFGGDNSAENLRYVCRTHNLYYAEIIFGRRKIQTEIERSRASREREGA